MIGLGARWFKDRDSVHDFVKLEYAVSTQFVEPVELLSRLFEQCLSDPSHQLTTIMSTAIDRVGS